MPFLSTTRRRVATVGGALAIAGGAGALALTSGAFASTPSAAPASSTAGLAVAAHHTGSHPAARAGRKRHGLLAHSDYATIELRRHGAWHSYTLDRGKVTAVTAQRITIHRPDGATVSIALNSTTKYKGVSGESAIKTGKHVAVISTNGTALRVRQPKHPKAASTTAAAPISVTAAG